MRIRHKNREQHPDLFHIVAFVREFSFRKFRVATFVYCRDKEGTPFKFMYEELAKYE